MLRVPNFLKTLFAQSRAASCMLCGDSGVNVGAHLNARAGASKPQLQNPPQNKQPTTNTDASFEKAALNLSPIFCIPCQQSLPFLHPDGCPQCAIEDTGGQLCGACIAHPPKFDATTAAFRYQFPLDRMVQDYKFNANFALLELFATALADRIFESGNLPDVIVPIPLSRQRIASRGFNQAALLADTVAAKLNAKQNTERIVRVEKTWLEKVRDTPAQAGLALEARRRNIADAFVLTTAGSAALGANSNLRIAILDDVITTGATLGEAAKVFKRAGVAHVAAIALARVPPPRAKLQMQNAPTSVAAIGSV